MDDLLQSQLDQGLQQLVILGAGYDSRAYRFDQLKKGVKVFEVDHPATQQVKVNKVKSVLGELPSFVAFIGVDFNRETLEEKLPAYGYDLHQKTLFIWEGVVMYLTPSAVDGTLSFILNHSGPGSQVVFDYIVAALLDGSVRHGEVSRMRRARVFSGEGLTFSIPEGKVEEFLEQRGFVNVVDVSSEALHARYFTGVNARRRVAWGYAIASAQVGKTVA
jgi:methyltransferase (TIGR00027 family)